MGACQSLQHQLDELMRPQPGLISEKNQSLWSEGRLSLCEKVTYIQTNLPKTFVRSVHLSSEGSFIVCSTYVKK